MKREVCCAACAKGWTRSIEHNYPAVNDEGEGMRQVTGTARFAMVCDGCGVDLPAGAPCVAVSIYSTCAPYFAWEDENLAPASRGGVVSALQHVYPAPNHIRIVRTGSGGSWCGSPRKRVVTENRTACGAPCTGHDVFPTRAGKLSRVSAHALVCPECRRLWELDSGSDAVGRAADFVAGIQRMNDERDLRNDIERCERVLGGAS